MKRASLPPLVLALCAPGCAPGGGSHDALRESVACFEVTHARTTKACAR